MHLCKDPSPAACLASTPYIDSDAPTVIAFARDHLGTGDIDPVGAAVRLFYAVRDTIRYDPYDIDLTPTGMKASTVLARKRGFCIAKAVVLAAAARVAGIPSRLGFADVRNHLTTSRLTRLMGGDVFVFHGYTELFLEEKWVKATPTFNIELCDRFGVRPLDFDGRNDALFHPFDRHGHRHMEYLRDRGRYPDLPFEEMVSLFRAHYPSFFSHTEGSVSGDFAAEADRDRKNGADGSGLST